MGLSDYEKDRWKRYAHERLPGAVAALLVLGVAVFCLVIGLALSPEPGLSRPWLIAAFVAFLLALGLGVFAGRSLRGR